MNDTVPRGFIDVIDAENCTDDLLEKGARGLARDVISDVMQEKKRPKMPNTRHAVAPRSLPQGGVVILYATLGHRMTSQKIFLKLSQVGLRPPRGFNLLPTRFENE